MNMLMKQYEIKMLTNIVRNYGADENREYTVTRSSTKPPDVKQYTKSIV